VARAITWTGEDRGTSDVRVEVVVGEATQTPIVDDAGSDSVADTAGGVEDNRTSGDGGAGEGVSSDSDGSSGEPEFDLSGVEIAGSS